MLALTGAVAYGDAPPPSAHYQTNPTAGDLDNFSGGLLVMVGLAVALYGYTRNDPRRRR